MVRGTGVGTGWAAGLVTVPLQSLCRLLLLLLLLALLLLLLLTPFAAAVEVGVFCCCGVPFMED